MRLKQSLKFVFDVAAALLKRTTTKQTKAESFIVLGGRCMRHVTTENNSEICFGPKTVAVSEAGTKVTRACGPDRR